MKPKVTKKKPRWKSTIVIAGFDVSMSSIAGAAIGYDSVLKRWKGPVCHISRWYSDDDYFSRIHAASKAETNVFSLISSLGIFPKLEEIHIAVEEPWPYGIVKNSDSGWLKQQAQMTGSFLGGLLRYGYRNVYEINSISWRKLVADDLGVTTHYSSWGKGVDGKMRAKEWAEEFKGWNFNFPDLIRDSSSKKLGLIDKPETSRAKPVQPADQYDALAIMQWLKGEVRRGLG